MGKRYYFLVCIFLSTLGINAQPQPDSSLLAVTSPAVALQKNDPLPFVVGDIYIEGNRRTRPYIITRELPYQPGDSISMADLVKGFDIARQQLMNSTLFNEVIISLKGFRGIYADISIYVKERWYIFPIPYAKPVDRNLSEWAKQGFGFDRVNYGFKFTYYNFTGRNDKLRMWLITGYTKQIQFQYDQPYADKSLKNGYKIGFSYSFNKEINYQTSANQQRFIDTLSGIKRWYGGLEYTYRPALRTFHGFRFGLTREEVDPRVLSLNPKYFNSQKNKVLFPEIGYTVHYYNVDYIPYPLTGWMWDAHFTKRGIHKDVNMWQVGGKVTKGFQLAKKTFFAWQSIGVLRVPFEQPFINQRLFGYGDLYLRGLEKYVIDGVAGFMSRQTLRQELFRFNINTHLRSKTHDRIPFKIYAKTFVDAGYAYNKYSLTNSLTNRLLYTGGFGIDIVTFYDFILRFDYSFNQLGQKGLFLHIKNDF